MPKDPTKNIDSYKIRGGTINEYEYRQNQAALAQQEPKGDGKLRPETPPDEMPQKSTKGTKTKTAAKGSLAKKTAARTSATKKSATKKSASQKSATKNSPRGASAKKLAARKAAKKK